MGYQIKFRKVICMSAVATCIAFSALAQGLPKATHPEDVGFSSERLKRLTRCGSGVCIAAVETMLICVRELGSVALSLL